MCVSGGCGPGVRIRSTLTSQTSLPRTPDIACPFSESLPRPLLKATSDGATPVFKSYERWWFPIPPTDNTACSWSSATSHLPQVRLYSDDDSLAFVRDEFPEYLEAYQALPANVQRADYFRYLALLRYGGVYVDTDVECKRPFDDIIAADDALVVGWENEFPTVEIATERTYARQKQILQWALAGAPGHPALQDVCDHIARFATHVFTPNKDRNILEVTGPGAWTDAVLRAVPPRVDPEQFRAWPVKVLPRVVMGNFPGGLDKLPGDAPGEVMVHQFVGSWKVKQDR